MKRTYTVFTVAKWETAWIFLHNSFDNWNRYVFTITFWLLYTLFLLLLTKSIQLYTKDLSIFILIAAARWRARGGGEGAGLDLDRDLSFFSIYPAREYISF